MNDICYGWEWIFLDEIIHHDVSNGDVNDDDRVVICDILTYSLLNTMYPMNIPTQCEYDSLLG